MSDELPSDLLGLAERYQSFDGLMADRIGNGRKEQSLRVGCHYVSISERQDTKDRENMK